MALCRLPFSARGTPSAGRLREQTWEEHHLRNKIVNVPGIKKPIQRAKGFEKKGLAEFKLDLLALCGFGCRYCSSNRGNYLRIRRRPFGDETERQLGRRLMPAEDPSLMFVFPDIMDRLRRQLGGRSKCWGRGKTLVFSMLTDGFSPWLVENGITEEALQLVVERTAFRVRVLTKNATVGSDRWVAFFSRHPGRFTVGLSVGTLDDHWARRMEIGTSPPSHRLDALRSLQDAGVPTYGMLCPVFPDVLEQGQLEALIDAVDPARVEHFWAEPYNDRNNWRIVRDSYPPGAFGRQWLEEVYEMRNWERWSRYATEVYCRLRDHARQHGWLQKLSFLLYEDHIAPADAKTYRRLEGVLLQSKPAPNGLSRNPHMARKQQ